ncbi:kinase-like domain-containing protein [Lipomyces oligophaga]|uniref:kinase-like domain-containing protein n=1 Tax=Lipomyces oligophaga TaxID=45792 RepID=UPI0034CFF505
MNPKKKDAISKSQQSAATSITRNESSSDHVDYVQTQADEVEVLKSIYGDDFSDNPTSSAWNKIASPSFNIHLTGNYYGDGESPLPPNRVPSLTLKVKFTQTYPRSVPLVNVESPKNIHRARLHEIQAFLQSKPRELLGEVMIYEIASSVQSQLDEIMDAISRETLEEERAKRVAEQVALAIKQEEEQRKQHESSTIEEARVLQEMIDYETRRRDDKIKRRNRLVDEPMEEASVLTDGIVFDRLIKSKTSDGTAFSFRQVVGKVPTASDCPLGQQYIVKPVVSDGDSISYPVFLLHEVTITESFWNQSEGKQLLETLESDLNSLKHIQHGNISAVFDFKIERHDSGWLVQILTEFPTLGTLENLLSTVGSVSVNVAREWSIQLLEGLEDLHKRGFFHRMLDLRSVGLFRDDSLQGSIAKISNVSYYALLEEMNTAHPFTSSSTKSLVPRRWPPPELADSAKPNRKSDIWDFGVIFLQMICGVSVIDQFESPISFIESQELNEPLYEFLTRIFKPTPKKRPSAFELLLSQFLRDSVPASYSVVPQFVPSNSGASGPPKFRRASSSVDGRSSKLHYPEQPILSRYLKDFEEVQLLGRGAYGEVVKARNRLDGRFYAVKKIRHTQDKLANILSEVKLLSSLSSQFVVRYITAWLEEDYLYDDSNDDAFSEFETPYFSDEEISTGQQVSASQELDSMSGLDIMSSSMQDFNVVFGYDSDDDSETPQEDSLIEISKPKNSALSPMHNRRETASQYTRSTLFIQMEYCEKHTLQDLIGDSLYNNPDDYWRYLQQILEALDHIHSQGIIHRDLKPSNIFIDGHQNCKVGDFGLATNVHNTKSLAVTPTDNTGDDLTSDVGTTLYVAVEVVGGGNYNEKVDMFSLGIIFFEMCYRMRTKMERVQVLNKLRSKKIIFPDDFPADRDRERHIVTSLLDHQPKLRPSASDLLRSGQLPVRIESDLIKQAVQSLIDPNSPWLSQVRGALFARPHEMYMDVLYDKATSTNVNDCVLRAQIVQRLTNIFRLHGAVEVQSPSILFPKSPMLNMLNFYQVVDQVGTVLQLPFDLTLPYARRLARGRPSYRRSFTFGNVYRNEDPTRSSEPRAYPQVDYDVLSTDPVDFAVAEAEVMKVLDEIMVEFLPTFTKDSTPKFILNHSDLLEMVLDACRINQAQRPSLISCLSNLFLVGMKEIKNELKMKSMISSAALDDLENYFFIATIEEGLTKLEDLFKAANYNNDRFKYVSGHMRRVSQFLKCFGVRSSFLSPLSNYSEQYYRHGIMFQVVIDNKRHPVISAGGRYDNLIKYYHNSNFGDRPISAVGFNFNWEYLLSTEQQRLTTTKKGELQNIISVADALVVSSASDLATREMSVRVVKELWDSNIRAELAVVGSSIDSLVSYARSTGTNWLIIVKSQVGHGSDGFKSLRVKNMFRKDDFDLEINEAVALLKSEHNRGTSSTNRTNGSGGTATREVIILTNDPERYEKNAKQNKGSTRKYNKRVIDERAHEMANNCVNSGLADAPIIAVDFKLETMALIPAMPLAGPDGWKKVVGTAPATQRQYLNRLHEVLTAEAAKGVSNVFLYSFRSEKILVLDLQK